MEKTGRNATEFAVGALIAIGTTLQQFLWPDAPFPTGSVTILTTWIAARFGEKLIGDVNTGGKRAWRTREFWVAMGVSGIKVVWPEMPEVLVTLAYTYIVGRPATKVMKEFSVAKLVGK